MYKSKQFYYCDSADNGDNTEGKKLKLTKINPQGNPETLKTNPSKVKESIVKFFQTKLHLIFIPVFRAVLLGTVCPVGTKVFVALKYLIFEPFLFEIRQKIHPTET